MIGERRHTWVMNILKHEYNDKQQSKCFKIVSNQIGKQQQWMHLNDE